MTKTNIGAVLKEHADVLARREVARQAFVDADADARALGQLIRDQGGAGLPGSGPGGYRTDWLRAAESAGDAFYKTLLPETSPYQIAEAYVRWKATLSKFLAT